MDIRLSFIDTAKSHTMKGWSHILKYLTSNYFSVIVTQSRPKLSLPRIYATVYTTALLLSGSLLTHTNVRGLMVPIKTGNDSVLTTHSLLRNSCSSFPYPTNSVYRPSDGIWQWSKG